MNTPTLPGVTIMGTGSWGTTLAHLCAGRGAPVTLLARDAVEAARLRADGENRRFLPGRPVPPPQRLKHDIAAALPGCQVFLFVVPAQTMRANVARVAAHLPADPAHGPVLVSAAKGLELETLCRMTEVIAQVVPPAWAGQVAALSGPNISREIADGKPATSVIAAADPLVTARAQEALHGATFRVYTNTDVVGVELAGALKNIIALGAGVIDGFGLGDNVKAAFITRGLAEITRLGCAEGGNALTFAGLAGVGDVIVTCFSPHSRNRRLGAALAAGASWEDAQRALGGVAEAITTTTAARALAARPGLDMPIIEQAHAVLFAGQHPLVAMNALLGRDPTDEMHGINLELP
jgi:glycerol-3-phosphate dehydrogenase (NAD(P)+)